jgi:hypothetical protein
MLRLALVGDTRFNLDALLRVADEVWGYSLAEFAGPIGPSGSATQRQPSDELSRFLVSLSSFQAGGAQREIYSSLFSLVSLSWIAVADQEPLNLALNYVPWTRRIVVPSPRRDIVIAFLQNTLDDCARAIRDDTRDCEHFDELRQSMEIQLEKHGIMKIIRQAK